MDRKNVMKDPLAAVVEALVKTVTDEPRTRHLDRVVLPSLDRAIQLIGILRQIAYPGYFGSPGLTAQNISQRLGQLVDESADILLEQVRCCLRYRDSIPAAPGTTNHAVERMSDCDAEALRVVVAFFERLPAVRQVLATDVQAAFDSDPAATSTDETIYCYPGLFAITVQRLAHELHDLQVPLLPRMMTEHVHGLTGIDIHPGARLGRSFFIDHGTGVVIGETTVIGNNVKIYQGVTLGALAPGFGQRLRGHKRHPTIEDNVTIYSGATILGGETVIGAGSVIGGNVFITTSVPPLNQVTTDPPKLEYRDRRPSARGADSDNFQI